MATLYALPGSKPLAAMPIAGSLESFFGSIYNETATGGLVANGSGNEFIQGWHYPTIDGSTDWTDAPENLQGDDGAYATKNFTVGEGNSGALSLTGFGFDIQDDATITGITLEMERFQEFLGGANTWLADITIQTLKAGVAGGTNKSTGATWYPFNGGLAVVTFGGSSDLWGRTWTPAEISDSGFGVYLTQGGNQYKGWLDYVRISVAYTVPAITGTGGALLNSTAISDVTYNTTGSGGAVAGSSAAGQTVYATAPTGGVTANSTGTLLVVRTISVGGTALLAGDSFYTGTQTIIPFGGLLCGSGTFANGYQYRVSFVVTAPHTISGFPVLLRLTIPGFSDTTTLHFEDDIGNTLAGEYIDYRDNILYAAVKADISTSPTTLWVYWN